jgi:nucleoside-diphosphate-sugar epimerase
VRALIIGGNRYFGRRLASLLLERGAEVTLLNRSGEGDGLGERVRRIRLDRRKLARGVVGEGSWDVVYDQACYDALEARGACAAFEGRAGRYVFTSSQSVYGQGLALAESVFDPRALHFDKAIDRDADYGEAKRQAEAVFFREGSFETTAVRFPIVLGPDDYTGRLKFHVDRVRDGKPIALPNPDARISLIHAADAAAFLAALAERRLEGPVNCCAPEPIRLSELLGEIERRTGRAAILSPSGDPSPFGVEHDWAMDAARAGEWGFKAAPISQWLPGLVAELAGP